MHVENGNEFLCITSNDCEQRRILEKFMCLSSGLYVTIQAIKSNKVMREDLLDLDTYWLCHDKIGHPSPDMMIRLLKTSHGHLFSRAK